MKITILEIQKIFRSPIIIILLLVSIGFNAFIILSNTYWSDELKVLNQLVDKYGLTFNDSTLQELEEDIFEGIQSIDKEADSAEAFFNQLTYEAYEVYDAGTNEKIDELSILFMYYNLAKELDARYRELDIQQIGEGVVQTYGVSGVFEKFVLHEYEKLKVRFNEMLEQEEYKTWFFAGNPYRMHTNLFGEVLKMIAVEGTILIVMISAFIACYEKDHRTNLVTYSTKTGRRLMMKKWQASLFGTFLIGILLMLPTLAIYFSVFDYHGLWQSRISSGLNWEYNLPYVTWWDISFIHYLVLAILITFSAWLLISMISFGVSVFIQNSYIATIIVYLLLVAMFVVPSVLSFSPLLLLLGHFNLTLLLFNPHMYFNGFAGLTVSEYHEVITLLLWLVISGVLMFISMKRFLRKDLD